MSQAYERALRPRSLDEFLGQKLLKQKLKLFLKAAQNRGEALDHVLFAGPPGLGKTTLAYLLARECGKEMYSVSAPHLERKADLASLLTQLQEGDFLFVDEIHRLPKSLEEVLYGAMEDFRLDVVLGQGNGAKTLQIQLAPFTLVGATTRTGLLSAPLRDRFGMIFRLDFYPPEELKEIVLRAASFLSCSVDEEAALEIAKRSRGTPRIAHRLMRRIRDIVEVKKKDLALGITLSDVQEAFELLEIDAYGLDTFDRKFLRLLLEKFEGGPVGLETLASALGEAPDTLECVYEPYLLQEGFLKRTPRGRMAGPQAYALFGLCDSKNTISSQDVCS